ncbi:type II secretion system F family protein [uncultured Hyphomicrobium sp.]|uniref:type II secretion system F family protein n=1 Tax=uncultured Hyphomicrobium sp. TaxID=194373 RepID=UPI0025FC69A4|nr:type II secretion system F family protein [uncultured Hyphomicrobium sp.]
MPRYSFKAYDANGNLRTGEISADTRGSALETLSRRAQTVVHLDEPGAKTIPWWQREIGQDKLSTSQLASFTRELSSLVKASLPVDETLRILSMQPQIRARLRQATHELLRRVSEGEQLSAAIASDRIFPEFYSRLVAAGEMSGALPATLEQLADYLERSAESRTRIVASLAYPALIFVAALVVIGVLAVVLVPAVLPIFADAGTDPPFIIRTLSGLGAIEMTTWIALIAAFLGIGVLAATNRPVRQRLDHAILGFPLVGPLVVERESGRFARALSMLLANDVPMLDALRISGDTLSSAVFRDAIAEAGHRLKEGESLATALARSSRVPPLLLRLVSVGEQTGQLGALTQRAAEIYEGAFQRRVDRLTAMATPILTLVIGGIVGVIVVSVLSAVLAMNALVLQ